MRVAIVGAGAMGSLLGHGFQRGGHSVSLLDLPVRVAQVSAMGGLSVIADDGSESLVVPARVTADFASTGIHDVVILATKAQDLVNVAASIPHLINEDTCVVTVQNGIPWWYLKEMNGEYAGRNIQCLDPDGVLARYIPSRQIIGCVAYPAVNLDKNGRVWHVEGKRFTLGELDGKTRQRTEALASLFVDAGYKSHIIEDIRSEIWLKAWGSLSINPISALTRATMVEICSFDFTRELIATMMREAQDIALALGASFRHTIEKRIEGARAVGAHKTSMLQDVEAGRPLELDALLLAVLELAEMTQQHAPVIRSIYACTALLNNTIQSRLEKQGELN